MKALKRERAKPLKLGMSFEDALKHVLSVGPMPKDEKLVAPKKARKGTPREARKKKPKTKGEYR